MEAINESLNHHVRQSYCHTRLKYRDGKQLTAVKVYSVISESKHLMVFGVPKINLYKEIKAKVGKFGAISKMECVSSSLAKDVELEQFTDCYHVVFKKLEDARKAKKFLDARNFYGGILHITYASERETVDELRSKLQQRSSEVKFRMRNLQKNANLKRPLDQVGESTVPILGEPSTSKIRKTEL